MEFSQKKTQSDGKPIIPAPTTKIIQQKHNEFLMDPTLRVFCFKCNKIIDRTICFFLQGEVCCVGCFAKLNPFPLKYQIISYPEFSILEERWSASDEILLLRALEIYRFGNWSDICEFMRFFRRQFSCKEIQQHYQQYYLSSNDFLPIFHQQGAMQDQGHDLVERKQKNIKSQRFSQKNEEIMGFNQKRKQFYQQYNPSLQKYIASLEFRDDDTPQIIDAKMQIIFAYNQALNNRYLICDFVIEHKLLNSRERQLRQKALKASPFLYQAEELLRGFRRFFNYEKYLEIQNSLENLLKQKKLIQSLRRVKDSERIKSIQGLSKFIKGEDPETSERLPKKRVHKNVQDTKEQEQKRILRKLGINKRDLKSIFQLYEEKREQQFEFRGISITILKPSQ